MNEEMSGHNYISNYISVPEFKEFTNAPESNEAMNEEMSGHNYISNYISVPEFKEVLHELVQDAVKNVVDKIIEKYLIRHGGEATGRDPHQNFFFGGGHNIGSVGGIGSKGTATNLDLSAFGISG